MASTAQPGTPLTIVGVGFEGAKKLAYGRSVLATGTVELVTGLSTVDVFVATASGDTNTETVCFRVREDLPSVVGTITVDGTKIDEGAAVANGGSEEFSWFAIGTV
jgi:hypothetical protein